MPERDRDARVEDLLLAGLDHYFAGQHELAISVWTRVLFLDRGHARARAYIDRARSAIAERQREGEELLHTGVAAFDRGDAATARTLLTSAVERGAHTEEALALLERIDRFEPTRVRPARSVAAPRADADADARSRPEWFVARRMDCDRRVLAGLATAGVVAWIALTRPDWLPLAPTAKSRRATAVAEEPLPMPSPSEAWVAGRGDCTTMAACAMRSPCSRPIGDSDPSRRERRRVARGDSAAAARSGAIPPPSRSSAAPPG